MTDGGGMRIVNVTAEAQRAQSKPKVEELFEKI